MNYADALRRVERLEAQRTEALRRGRALLDEAENIDTDSGAYQDCAETWMAMLQEVLSDA